MRSEFLVERDGKSFVLYAGLLDAAHAAGLQSISTELIQLPAEENQHVAVVRAGVRLVDAAGVLREFSGIGDAGPQNVTRSMVPHLIRMAETRAKARALRDAVNIGVAALEEIDAAGAAEAPARRVPAGARGDASPMAGREVHCKVCHARVHPAAAQIASDGSYRCPRHREEAA